MLDVNPAWLMFGDEKATPLTDEAREGRRDLDDADRRRARPGTFRDATAGQPPDVVLTPTLQSATRA